VATTRDEADMKGKDTSLRSVVEDVYVEWSVATTYQGGCEAFRWIDLGLLAWTLCRSGTGAEFE
jgi:hypothetical protein